jgi:hypothetical protein
VKRLKWVAVLLGGVVLMKAANVGPGDLWTIATTGVSKARNDSNELASGAYRQRIADSLRQEAGKLPSPEGADLNEQDKALRADLTEARKKLLDDRAAALEKHSESILRGDLNSLKRDVAENARNAAGAI